MKRLFMVLAIVILADVAAISDGWQFNRATDPIDDSQSAIFSIESDSAQSNQPMALELHYQITSDANHDNSLLLISVRENTLSDHSKITIRFDKQKAYTDEWIVNGQRNCLVWPNADYFISMVLKSRKLAIRVNNGYKEMTAIFDVSGLKDCLLKNKFSSIEWLHRDFGYDADMKAGVIAFFQKNGINLDVVPFSSIIWSYVILNYSDFNGNDEVLKAKISDLIKLAKQNNVKMPPFQDFYTSYDFTERYYEQRDME